MPQLRRIDNDPDQDDRRALIRKTMCARIDSAEELGQGAFGIVYRVRLSGDGSAVIVKWQKRPGRGALEKRQLEELGNWT